MKSSLYATEVNQSNSWLGSWIQLDSIKFSYNYFFLSKIDTYKIENQPNIKAIEKKSNKKNYVAQIIIKQILNDEIENKKSKRKKKDTIVMDKKIQILND